MTPAKKLIYDGGTIRTGFTLSKPGLTDRQREAHSALMACLERFTEDDLAGPMLADEILLHALRLRLATNGTKGDMLPGEREGFGLIRQGLSVLMRQPPACLRTAGRFDQDDAYGARPVLTRVSKP